MVLTTDLSVVDWSRAQFALTAMYHWLFVPLTLGLSFVVAIMESIYVKTGNPEWKKITKFWMTLFGINFAIGVATGIILEFQFGTNWSNYSWFVGDIFGAPLAIEGIMAFFLESTFIAIMFFGWKKVSKKTHLAASWLTAIGANLSALWILVANAWMQYPAGMHFNPDTARNEMVNFWEVLFSPVAVHKFLHTISSGYVTAALFVVGISAWYLIKKREVTFAKKSIVVGAIFGLITSLFLAFTGDGSAYTMAQHQPMKFAAMEGLYDGKEGAGMAVIGILTPGKEYNDNKPSPLINLEIPKLISLLGYKDANAFVPGIKDLVDGNPARNIISTQEKIDKGKIAIHSLAAYTKAKKEGNKGKADSALVTFNENFKYFGYGYLNNPQETIPNVPITFYSFKLMVGLGVIFIILFIIVLIYLFKNTLEKKRWLLWFAVFSFPLAYFASQAGWILTEVGRQPWVIQDLMPNVAAVSRIDSGSVAFTFWLFAFIFTSLLIAEVTIMIKQIKNGPNKDGGQ